MTQRLSFRLSAFDTNRTGTVFDDTLGEHLGEFDRSGARAQLLWTPAENTRVRFIADYYSQDEDGPGFLLVNSGTIMANGSTRPNNFLDRSARAGYIPVIDPVARRNDADARQRIVTDQAGFSAQADVRLGEHLLTSISAWRQWKFLPQNDGDFTALDIVPKQGTSSRHEQLSQELRLSSASDGQFDYMIGAYLFFQELESASNTIYGANASDFMTSGLTPLALDGFRVITNANPETDSYAAFAQGTWRPASAWSSPRARAGPPRRAALTFARSNSGGAPLPTTSAAAIAARERIGGTVTADVETDEDFVSGLLSARFAINHDSITYLSLARGAKSGGINVAIVPPGVDPNDRPRDCQHPRARLEESVARQQVAAELRHVLDGCGRLPDDVSRSHSQYVLSHQCRLGALRAAWNSRASIVRPPTSTFPWRRAGTTPHSRSSRNAPCPVETVNPITCDFTGERVPGSPPWSATAAIHYDFPLGAGGHRAFTDVEYTHTPAYQLDFSSYTREESYGLANLQLGFQSGDDRWRVWLWGRNLLDEDYYVTKATSGVFASGATIGLFADPRTYGLSARARF